MTTNPMLGGNAFKLGTFSTNCSSGMSVTKVPERWVNSWENNLRLGQMLDEAGIDFMLPIARWIGYGGETDFHGSVLETMTWAAALLASTRNIAVFATIHTSANHPAVVAKQIATIDQIGRGRAGLNIVAGWNKPEYEALGLQLPDDHETRYAYAQEWFDVVRKLWTSTEHFDWEGTYFKLAKIKGDPRPLRGSVPIINAAGSPQGRNFATDNADFLFTPAIDLDRSTAEIAELHAQSQAKGRKVDVLTFSHVICRPTEAEARAYLKHTAEDNADWVAVDNLIRLQFAHAQSFPHDLMKLIRDRFAAGHGGFPLIGTPEQVAEGILSLHRAGFAGTTLSFVDYAEEFPYFRDTVLPLLEQAGIRTPRRMAHGGGMSVQAVKGPDKAAFLGAMRQFVGSVSVITVGQGEDLSGLVVTSAVSLSADPPLVLICVNRGSSSWPLLARHGIFGVNALGAQHQALAEQFSGFGGIKGAARYAGAEWVTGATGARLLADAPVALDCMVEEMIDRATHSIVVGRVRAVRVSDPQGALVYWHGGYRGLPL